jgi:hypothetical protein
LSGFISSGIYAGFMIFLQVTKAANLYRQRIDEPNRNSFIRWVHLSVGKIVFKFVWLRLTHVVGILFYVTLAVFTLPPKLTAQNGGQAGAYLQAGAGVRALGLGDAFVAIANDVTAGYWNPAGLGQLNEPQFAGMHSVLSLDRKYNYVAAAYPFGAAGTIGVSWVNYQVGQIEARDREGVVTGKFSNQENALLISYGKTLRPALALGGGVKLLRHDLAQRRASGIGYDLGVLFKPSEVFALGGSLQNLRTQIRWNDPKATRETFLPRQRIGAQIKPASSFLVSVDYEMAARQPGKFHVGGEIFFGSFAGLRLGNDDGAMTLGASVLAHSARQNFSIEYGLRRDPVDQSFAHQIALILKFNKPPRAVVNENVDLAESQATANTTTSAQRKAEPQSQLMANPVPPARQEMEIPPQTIFLVAQVIEVRPPFIIIGADDFAGLQSGMALKVYQSMLGKETGRGYGAGKLLDVSPRYAIIELNETQPAAALKVGDKLLLKAGQ